MRTARASTLFVSLLIVGACGVPDSIRASDYDQSCAADGDCVLVSELVVENGECDDCRQGAVNVKDARRMAEDVQKERDDCSSDGPTASCKASGKAACVSGRCTVVPK